MKPSHFQDIVLPVSQEKVCVQACSPAFIDVYRGARVSIMKLVLPGGNLIKPDREHATGQQKYSSQEWRCNHKMWWHIRGEVPRRRIRERELADTNHSSYCDYETLKVVMMGRRGQ